MTKVLIPVDQANFERLRAEARAAAGKASAPKPTSADQVRKPSPAEPIRKIEESRSKTPENPRAKTTAPLAPTSEPDAGPVDEDIQDIFFGRR